MKDDLLAAVYEAAKAWLAADDHDALDSETPTTEQLLILAIERAECAMRLAATHTAPKSGFHTATICASCDPPVVALSTGNGSRCPTCGQHEAWLHTERDTQPDRVLAHQVLVETALRSDGEARLLSSLATRLLDRIAKTAEPAPVHVPGTCPHCRAGEPSVWDDVLFHYAHPAGSKLKICHAPWRARCRRCSADVAPESELCARHGGTSLPTLSSHELDELERHLDDETEWETVSEFWDVWGPRISDRLRRLIATARQGGA